jgi:tRNA(Ile)-lysidine synthase
MRLRRLEPVLRRALRGPCALPAGTRALVAVSGGADSTALLVALASVAREFGLSLTAAHLHHGLRGADADADLAHVAALCERLRVPLRAARWDTRARMRREGLAGEAGLRVLRRRFLLAEASRAGAAAILTAHTADDQLETLLMRLARGTGLAGLGGMAPRRGPWRKPLLEATRLDVERDLVAARITWREDASNRERGAFRNRVRLDVVPALLEAFAPGKAADRQARAGLARRVAQAAGDARSGGRLAAAVARRALARAGAENVGALAALPAVARDAALRQLWRAAHPGADGLARRHLAALAAVLVGRPGAVVALPGGWQGRRERGRLRLSPGREGSRPPGPRSAAARPRVADNAILRQNNSPSAARARRRLPAGGSRRSTPVRTRPRGTSRVERHD